MAEHDDRSFGADFKRFFLRGLVILLPTVLTLWIVMTAYLFVYRQIASPINEGVKTALVQAAKVWQPLRDEFTPTDDQVDQAIANTLVEPEKSRFENKENTQLRAEIRERMGSRVRSRLRSEAIITWWDSRWYMNGIGLVVAIVAVYIAGRLLGGFFGKRLYRRIEQFITTLPVFKQVYPHVKQIVDFLFSDDKPIKFNRVVAVEYPRKGIWSVGFQTGGPMRTVAAKSGDSSTVFIPSSPTPFTGYTITVNKEDLIELPITVEEAIRFAVSGGVLVPDHQVVDSEADASLRAIPGLIPKMGDNPSESPENADDKQADQSRKDAI